jgi:hypothetical protein
LFAKDHLLGERNGKKYGEMLSIVVKNVEEIKTPLDKDRENKTKMNFV